MTATRPVSAAPIATAWGQDVHDGLFTPFGGILSAASVTGIATTATKLPMTAGGPNLSTGDFLVPANGAGIYLIQSAVVVTVAGAANNVHTAIRKNAVDMVSGGSGFQYIGAAAGSVINRTIMAALAVGDRISLYCNGGSGTSGMACSGFLSCRKIGDSFS